MALLPVKEEIGTCRQGCIRNNSVFRCQGAAEIQREEV